MCDSFIAKNFRAFEEIKVQKLAQVNLFIGKNSVGKTALLEALHLYLHKSKTEAIYKLLLKKEEHLSSNNDLASVVKHLFYKHKLPNSNEPGITLSSLKPNNEVNKSKSVTITTDTDNGLDSSLMIGEDNKKQGYPLYKDFERFYRHHRMFEDDNNQDNLRFVYSMGIDNDYVAELWDNITLDKEQNDVIKSLQIIEPKLSDVAFIEVKRSRSRTAIAKVLGEKVPFRSMGDGINRILYIVLSMVNAQNGYLLIDEFENGLHYSVQKQVWQVIFALSKSLNVQVFVTTHSSDCIKAFGTQWQDNEKSATLHRIDFYNKKHSVMPYSYENLDNALQTDTEVR